MQKILLVIFLLFSTIHQAWALSCIEPQNPRDEFAHADAVFAGKVIRFVGTERKFVTFEVLAVWKGVIFSPVILEATQYSVWYSTPEVGQEFLVYAQADQHGGLSMPLCSRTTILSEATEDLQTLGPPGNPVETYSDPSSIAQVRTRDLLILTGILVIAIFTGKYIRKVNR